MLEVTATAQWRAAHAGAAIGLLEVSGVDNSRPSAKLEQAKRATEARLRERCKGFARPDFLALPAMAAYDRYYKRFGNTYHVQLQVESIVLKGKDLPSVSPLVDANFAAEVETLVLTAGHDAAKLRPPLVIDVSRENDRMVQMNGKEKAIRAGDMIMRDAAAVSCSILNGQDNRSPISPATTHALFVAYVPAGVPAEALEAQLAGIEAHVRLFAPQAAAERRVLRA